MPTQDSTSLQIRHTGAVSHEAAQADPDASLGNYLASTTYKSRGIFVSQEIVGIRTDDVSGVCPSGFADLMVTAAGDLKFKAPESITFGAAVTIANGETKQIHDGDDPRRWIEVTRTTDDAISGAGRYVIGDHYNGLYNNWANADRAAGASHYRAVGMIVPTGHAADNIKVFLSGLGSTRLLNGSYTYGATGNITLTTSEGDFSNWPIHGFGVYNVTQGHVHYVQERTSDTSVSILSADRDIWTDGDGAGADGDVLIPVSACRFKLEAPTADQYTTHTDEDDNASLTYTHGTIQNVVSAPANLAAGDHVAVHIQLYVPAGAQASRSQLVAISFYWDGTESAEGWGDMEWGSSGWGARAPLGRNEIRDRIRIEDTTLDTFGIWVNAGSAPDTTAAPDETFTAKPYTTTLQLDLSATSYVIAGERNVYGMWSLTDSWLQTTDGAGLAVLPSPASPEHIDTIAASAGAVLTEWRYDRTKDATNNRADTWAVWYKSDGSNPDPDSDPADYTESMSFNGDFADLELTMDGSGSAPGPFVEGATIKVIARARRSSDTGDSTNSTIQTVTATLLGPSAASRTSSFLGEVAEAKQ